MRTVKRKPAALCKGRAGLGDITSSTDHTKKFQPEATCPKFDGCSANICPLDPDWRLRRSIKGESVCLYLREAVKPGARAILDRIMPVGLPELVLAAVAEISARHAPIKSSLKRSARTPSMLIGADRLNLEQEVNR